MSATNWERLLAFVIVNAAHVAVWWLGGFDFDKREPVTAVFAICAVLINGLYTALTFNPKR